jgi:RNA 2',3'-cyclic 3'-phosphodiesterase
MLKKEKIRLFTGLPIPASFLELFQNFIDRNKGIGTINWVQPHNMHITLSFIGETVIDQVEEIAKKTALLSEQFPPFEFVFKEINVNSKENPRMLWATFSENETFQEMYLASNELLCLGPVKYPKIIPHVTLGRFKNLSQPEALVFDLPADSPTLLEVKKIILWESQLSNRGAEYTALKEFNLKYNGSPINH